MVDGRRRRGAGTREALLAAGLRIASVDGLEGLTIGRLAAATGRSKGTIATQFGDKQRLQLAILDAAVKLFDRHVVRPVLAEASPRARLLGLCRNWFGYVDARVLPGGCLLYASLCEFRARPGPVQDRIRHHYEGWLAVLRRLAVQAGHADPAGLAHRIAALQAAANVASLLGDADACARGYADCRRLIEEGSRAGAGEARGRRGGDAPAPVGPVTP